MSAIFSSISRYRRIPDVVTIDSAGQAVTSKDFRLVPPMDGTFRHTVVDIDRLDHLGFKYYDQPRDWWRILDANPEFVAPDALLGSDPFATTAYEIAWAGPGPVPPWSMLFEALAPLPGVIGAWTGTADAPVPAVRVIDGPLAFTLAVGMVAQLDTSTRTQQPTASLAAALTANGVVLSADVRISKIAPTAWRIVDLADLSVRTFRFDPVGNVVNVDVGTFRHDWVVTVVHNRALVAATDVLAAIEALGFQAGPPREVRRIGKPIVIPPRTP
jgi:hypothetical protein